MQAEEQREKNEENEESLREMLGITKWTNIHVMGVPERKDKEEQKESQRNNGWKLPRFTKEHHLHIQDSLTEFQVR